ncbi:dimethylargininase [Leifsonia shinshuensis]|uniref:Dimethylarginine dimethylaminohydrolase n=1 Tax=Leifsonia shinshuensis TaxID=150026 RepID=A0A7G6YF83_9MICO|nr:dimethylargininase [Leifsonia shinshuensis]QNE37148.1 dimethylarginine dimethylaminohydrolase [Leifsonia shinshuensis]
MTSSWARRLVASLVSAVAVAAIGLVAATLVLLVANQLNSAVLGSITPYVAWNALAAFVLAAIAALLGAYDRRWIAVVAGILVGLISAAIGTLVLFSTLNVTLTGQAWGQIASSFIGINLPFWLAVAIAFPTAGFAVFGAIESQGGATARKIALVRIPAGNLSEGLITHIEREAVDSELADKQWDDYVAALSAAGWQTVEVASADQLADSVFVEDTAVVFGDTAVISRPGADERKPEVAGTEAALRAQGLRLERIEEPGTLDGGDVLKVGDTVYVGRGGRTNAEGIRQLRALVAPLGYTVVAVPVTKALHLKTAVTALPDGTVIGYEPIVDDPRIFQRFLPVPEAHGTAVVVLDDATVLMSSSAPGSVALVEDLGYTVIQVDISEFEKLEGCVTCLSIRIR